MNNRNDSINNEWESTPVDFDPFADSEGLSATAPSTEPQREIWAAATMSESASCAYNAAMCLRLRGELDIGHLQSALHALVARHDALRVSFTADGETLCINQDIPLDTEVIDLAQARLTLEDLRQREVRLPFDLVNGPLFRCRIARVDAHDHALLMTGHHLVCDGWSMGVLIEELAAFYNAFSRGEETRLAAAPSFQDYAHMRSHALDSDALRAQEDYWVECLRDGSHRIELPADVPRSGKRSFDSGFERRRIALGTLEAIRRQGAKNGCTSFTVIAAAFAAWMHRLTGQDDLVIGIPAAGQTEEGWQGLVGHCTSLLPVRSRFEADMTFAQFLKEFRGVMADAQENRAPSLGRIVQRLGIPRDPSIVPLVQVVLNIDREIKAPTFDRLQCEYDAIPRPYENFEIFMNTVETGEGLVLECAYDRNVMSESAARRRLREFDTFVQRLCESDAGRALSRISIAADADRRRLLEDWGRGVDVPIPDASVAELVRAQAERTPEAIAVRCGDAELDYRELLAQADRVSAQLRARGVEAGDVIGVQLERTPALPAILLGIWEAGAAYLPLDPEHPAERSRMMLDDAGARLVITDVADVQALQDGYAGQVVDRDAMLSETGTITDEPKAPASHTAANDRAAYLIYTSGSTGKPKGVVVPHRTVVNFLLSMQATFNTGSQDRVLALTTLTFDIAVLELWMPLIAGALTEIVPRDVARDGDRLRALIEERQPTLMQATPATWQLMLNAGWQGDEHLTALSGGEALPAPMARELLARSRRVWNMYGPTETTVWSTCHQVTSDEDPVSIGKPIANTRVYVLDKAGQLAPAGVPGELYIGGDGVADGYLNRPELTRERFLPDPFSDQPGARMYRTGDRVRFRSDGKLECLGRLDYQVKLRGHRIEPGEIEAALQAREEIRRAVVTVYSPNGASDDVRLVAYLVLAQGARLNIDGVRRELRAQLPAYMVPQHFMALEQLPLTGSGKVDRKALPSPLAQTGRQHVPPRTETEQQIATIWQEILGVERIGANDNFFDLGGHSLSSMRAIARIDEQLGCRLRPRLLVLNTLAEIAASVEQERAQRIPPAASRGKGLWGSLVSSVLGRS